MYANIVQYLKQKHVVVYHASVVLRGGVYLMGKPGGKGCAGVPGVLGSERGLVILIVQPHFIVTLCLCSILLHQFQLVHSHNSLYALQYLSDAVEVWLCTCQMTQMAQMASQNCRRYQVVTCGACACLCVCVCVHHLCVCV